MKNNILYLYLNKTILETRIGQWRIIWKNDGFDYPLLLNRFLSGDINSQKLTTGSLYGTVHKVSYKGRLFVIKHNTEQDHRLEKRLFSYLAGTRFSRLILLTAKAIQQGCPVVQDVYLVKEKMAGRSCSEAYIISEYVPGQSFIKENSEPGQPIVFFRPGENLALIAEALGTLHAYGLASNDAIISNFILTDQNKIKVIDLRPNTPILIGQANDVLKMRRSYQTEVPINGWLLKILVGLLTFRDRLKQRLRVWRKRVPPPPPPKIWEDFPSTTDTTTTSPGQPNRPTLGVDRDLTLNSLPTLKVGEANSENNLEKEKLVQLLGENDLITAKQGHNASQRILLAKVDQWRIQWINDGFDYQSLLNSFLAGEVTGQRLATETPFRVVHKVEFAGRLFVVKHDEEIDRRLEKRLWFYLAGTMYSRLIRLTDRAIEKGCPILQKVYLVKERMSGRFCQEAYVVAEYVPGQSFMKETYEEGSQAVFLRPGDNLPLIAKALGTLHSYGLASNDVKISNFILTPSGQIKIIDLSTNTPIILAKINDILETRKLYDIEVPSNSALVGLLARLMSLHRRFKHRLRVWRKKVPAQRPPKIWEDLPNVSISKSDEKSENQDLDDSSESLKE
ncbi:MAG: hypothetical protein LBI10_00415 [Deltaproteobacteria bacterium]|jgi:heptose II phosphotransferase|nr:hypothetical protein [Deltaproteobacteria bacterium]